MIAEAPTSERIAVSVERVKKRHSLTSKQARFVAEYVVDFNATQAAVRAGYSRKTAGQIGNENLKKPAIQRALGEFTFELNRLAGVDAESVIEELRRIGFSDITNIVEWDAEGRVMLEPSRELSTEVTAAVKKVKVKERIQYDEDDNATADRTFEFELHDKLSALDKLAKRLQLYQDLERGGDTFNVFIGGVPPGMLKQAPASGPYLPPGREIAQGEGTG